MESNFLQKQAEVLKKQKEDLERELLQVAEKKKTGEKYEPKFIDFGQKEDEGAQEVATYEEYLVLEKNLSQMLKETERALKKIEKGRYGFCESCKKPIEKERLEAFPTATLCLSCANKPKRRFTWAFWRRGR
jgi:DnaK suppressor protein